VWKWNWKELERKKKDEGFYVASLKEIARSRFTIGGEEMAALSSPRVQGEGKGR